MELTSLSRQALLLAAVVFSISSADAKGSTITLSDSTFAPGDWNTFLLYDSKPGKGASGSGFQDTSVGLPAPSLGGTLVSGSGYGSYENMGLVQRYEPSVLNPIHVASPNSIDSVSMAFDFELLPNPVYAPAQIQLQSVVSQNGKYYFGPAPFSTDHAFTSQGWTHVTFLGLHTSDFTEISPSLGPVAGSHPDFLSPFSVGIGVLRSTQIYQLPGEWRIDNWTTQVNVVPEPSMIILTAIGGLALLAYRRRRA